MPTGPNAKACQVSAGKIAKLARSTARGQRRKCQRRNYRFNWEFANSPSHGAYLRTALLKAAERAASASRERPSLTRE
jgi:hypothetical protein